jgi:hypothetical protein
MRSGCLESTRHNKQGEGKMSNTNKLIWLKRILAAKVIYTFFFSGLPLLLYPTSLLQWFGMPIPDYPIYIRILGAVITAVGVAYWYAYKDPVHNIAILKVGIVDNGLVTLVNLIFIVFYNFKVIAFVITLPITIFFFISFILLMPKTEAA